MHDLIAEITKFTTLDDNFCYILNEFKHLRLQTCKNWFCNVNTIEANNLLNSRKRFLSRTVVNANNRRRIGRRWRHVCQTVRSHRRQL